MALLDLDEGEIEVRFSGSKDGDWQGAYFGLSYRISTAKSFIETLTNVAFQIQLPVPLVGWKMQKKSKKVHSYEKNSSEEKKTKFTEC